MQNQIRVALQKKELPEILREAPLGFFVRQLLGELEGEHANSIEYKAQKGWIWSNEQFFFKNYFFNLLENCRGVFNWEQLGYTVWNILTILKEMRSYDFSGADFQQLIFKSFSFNELLNSHPRLHALFCHGFLDENCIFSQGHSGGIKSAAFNPDGSKIITTSEDRIGMVWDATTGECIYALPNVPGLFIQGCDFRNLHPDSKLSEENIAIMRQYGGIFDDEDARRWEELEERHFGIRRK